mgnify:FL=1
MARVAAEMTPYRATTLAGLLVKAKRVRLVSGFDVNGRYNPPPSDKAGLAAWAAFIQQVERVMETG